jgi:pyruvate kinase
MDLDAKAIITVTISGFTARMVSRYKPNCPIIACSTSAQVCRQMNLCWGVTPIGILKEDTADHLFMTAIETAKREGLIAQGDTVVLTAGVPLGVSGKTNMIRVIEVE